MSQFGWHPAKSKANRLKHGISFAEAVEIWKGPHLTVEGLARTKAGERRSATVGVVGRRLFTAIWTRRDGAIRLISVRRARDGEKEAFYKSLQR